MTTIASHLAAQINVVVGPTLVGPLAEFPLIVDRSLLVSQTMPRVARFQRVTKVAFAPMPAAGNQSAQLVLRATKQPDLRGALQWIAEGHPLQAGTGSHELLRAVADVSAPADLKQAAARRLTRQVADSELDTAAVIFELQTIVPPLAFRNALDLLAWKSPEHDLTRIDANAVAAAQREDPGPLD
jgi:hypothetical protein